MSKYGWKSSLAKGKAGEELFMSLQPGLTKLDGKAADYIDQDGNAWELKSDQYPMASTANIFLERWSCLDTLKPGGPFQSFGRGCKFYAYLYAMDKVAFIYPVIGLMKFVEEQEKLGKLKPVYIKNARHTTVGYKLPRAAIEHLLIKVLK